VTNQRAADVVIVGGGIVGASAAAFLAEAGAHVVLVERDRIGAAASGRNSGFIQGPFDPTLAGLHTESLDLYRRLGQATRGTATPFALPDEPSGLLMVSTDPSATEQLAQELTALVPHLEPLFVSGSELQRLEPTLAPDIAACRLGIGYPVRPASAVEAYAALARSHGAQLALGSPAQLEVVGDRVTGVNVDGRSIGAETVIVAAGPWTPAVVDPTASWRPIFPIWGVIVEIELERPPSHVLEESENTMSIEPPASGEVDMGEVVFSLITAAGRSSLGSTFLREQPAVEGYHHALVERGARFVPGVAGASIVGTRVCPRPVSRDGRPLVGPVPWLRGAIVAAGHGPWGISTGPATGRMAAELALGREPSIPAALSPARFGQRRGERLPGMPDDAVDASARVVDEIQLP
jgi:glycine/D-amino acid oxidase-like deaminating enzyme